MYIRCDRGKTYLPNTISGAVGVSEATEEIPNSVVIRKPLSTIFTRPRVLKPAPGRCPEMRVGPCHAGTSSFVSPLDKRKCLDILLFVNITRFLVSRSHETDFFGGVATVE